MKKLMTKKSAMIFFGLFALIFLLPMFFFPYLSSCGSYREICKSLALFTLPLSTCFPIVLLLLFFRDQIFLAWLKFTIFVMPIILLIIYQSPSSAGGGFLSSAMTTTRSEVSIQLSILYGIVSLIIILVKSLVLRGKK